MSLHVTTQDGFMIGSCTSKDIQIQIHPNTMKHLQVLMVGPMPAACKVVSILQILVLWCLSQGYQTLQRLWGTLWGKRATTSACWLLVCERGGHGETVGSRVFLKGKPWVPTPAMCKLWSRALSHYKMGRSWKVLVGLVQTSCSHR